MPFLEVKSPRWTRRIDLISDPVSVGRLPDNGIQFNDDGLSRQHCVFERTPEGWQIRDLGSRNGTKLNGSKVTAGALASGDIVRVGTLEIRFVDPEPAKPVAAPAAAAPSRAPARPGATIAATPTTQSPYEAALREVCDGSLSKQFGESDIALVDARGAVMHAATGAGESDDEDEAPAESIHIFRML
ncbi:MAG: FHA domain-containing protein, partial [Phycisphaerales bacterium]